MTRATTRTARVVSPVDRYVDAVFDRFERALGITVRGLGEPIGVEPALAMKRLGCVVETLVGFAIGTALGAIGRTARREMAEPARGLIVAQLTRALEERPSTPLQLTYPRFIADAHLRPLVDELGARLNVRLRQSLPFARAQLAALHAAIARTAPDQIPAFEQLLERLAADDAPALGWKDQLELGWAHLEASVRDTPPPAIPEGVRWTNTRELWRSWLERVVGVVPTPEPSQAVLVEAGFIMRIG